MSPIAARYVLVDPRLHWKNEFWTHEQVRACALEQGARVVTGEEAIADTKRLDPAEVDTVLPKHPGDWIERYDARGGEPLTHWAPLD